MLTAFDPKCSLPPNQWISLSKPQQVINCCWDSSLEYLPVTPLTQEQAYQVHEINHVKSVFNLEVNGFWNEEPSPEVLTQVLYANGAMIAAVDAAVVRNLPVFAPVSGFHHAGYDYSQGFCTFNGIVIALELAKQRGLIETALIMDFDGHYGDGTQDLVQRGRQWITHQTRTRPYREAHKSVEQALEAMRNRPDVIIYQAGADSHINDSFGAGYFTDSEWKDRDLRIFSLAKELNIPIVWNLAGGYSGKHTILLHASTFETACSVFEPIHPSCDQTL